MFGVLLPTLCGADGWAQKQELRAIALRIRTWRTLEP
jgi:hypothetical protein